MIYFIQTTCERGFIKIGTARNFRQRLDQLQRASPYRLKVVRTLPGGKTEERAIHERFAAARERGEWFNATDELCAYIQATADQCLGGFPTPEDPDADRTLTTARLTAYRAKQRMEKIEDRYRRGAN